MNHSAFITDGGIIGQGMAGGRTIPVGYNVLVDDEDNDLVDDVDNKLVDNIPV